jgi:hypothetical protein
MTENDVKIMVYDMLSELQVELDIDQSMSMAGGTDTKLIVKLKVDDKVLSVDSLNISDILNN